MYHTSRQFTLKVLCITTERSMEQFDGNIQWNNSMETFDGTIRWNHSLEPFVSKFVRIYMVFKFLEIYILFKKFENLYVFHKVMQAMVSCYGASSILGNARILELRQSKVE